jgi:hypothetical protein
MFSPRWQWLLHARSAGASGPTDEFEFRTAAIHPVDDDGRIAGELGYRTDPVASEARSSGLLVVPLFA